MADYDFRDNLITLTRFNSPMEGELAIARLEDAGIKAQLASGATATWLNAMGPDLVGAEVLVRQGDLRRARQVLADVLDVEPAASLTDDSDEDQDEDYWATDWSGEEWSDDDDDLDDEWSEEAERPAVPPLSRAFRASVFGWFLFPPVLNLYSVWVIVKHRLWETDDYWRYYATIGFNVLGVVVAWLVWSPFVR